MALDTSPDNPAPLRVVSAAIGQWLGRLGAVWVEAQVAELTLRQDRVYLVLRDPLADMSVQASCSRRLLDALPVPLTEGARVVAHARPSYYDRRGSLSLYVDVLRPVGLGELLARLEQRRRLLAAEGLFASERKRPLPFLPRGVGLVTGKGSAAERDVLEVARRRWPGVRFRVEHTLVQGRDAALQVIEALRRLDADAEVDVIVVARGGGSMEDLLPFSDEGLVRVVAALRTPLVSAIGHEPDNPILDLVADVRAATPTDAAKHVVPDVIEELAGVRQARDRARRAVAAHLATETRQLATLSSRPALAAPHAGLDARREVLQALRVRARRTLSHRLDRAGDEVGHQLARARALSPLATLRRGYAVVQTESGHVLAGAAAAAAGDGLSVRLHDGRVGVRVETVTPEPAGGDDE
ncbi:MAG TPA: exodeoxyribonuclease VII large subunit [Nocardioidaceae bacterium]|nr:exodeoxyribonuclease VII large subunit [Nocardioidaceae bacterium]